MINEHDESKTEEFYKQQCALNIPFRESLATFFNQLVENDDDTWMSIFERYNFGNR